MDLREELTRQGLLLDFLSECVSLGSVADLTRLVTSRLHWICDYEVCTAFLPEQNGLLLWSHDRHAGFGETVSEDPLLVKLRALLEETLQKGSPVMASFADMGRHTVALPLGTAQTVHGSLCLSRTKGNFSHGDIRHLQHACRAVGGALTRIAALRAEHEAEHAMTVVEAQLRAAAEDRALLAEQMVGIVSHDLRNPLSAILMGTMLLVKGEPLPTQKERVVQKVSGAARRAQRLVEDLLDFTQARMGQGLALKKRDVDLNELISSAVDELRLSFPTLEFRSIEHRLGFAYLDADRVHQVLGNLVANAVTYGTAGSPVVLQCNLCDDQVTLSVHNWGEPISPKILVSMFEPMIRGDQKQLNRSVGLGLYLVRVIVESHGGSIQVASTQEDGTCFAVSLPIDARVFDKIPAS